MLEFENILFDANLTISENGFNTGNYLTRQCHIIGNFYDITLAISTPLKEHKKGILEASLIVLLKLYSFLFDYFKWFFG